MKRWGGRAALAVRAHLARAIASGDVLCPRCGRLIRPDEPWDVGHELDQALGGNHHLENLRAEHRACNRRSGQALGQARMAAQRRAITRTRKW